MSLTVGNFAPFSSLTGATEARAQKAEERREARLKTAKEAVETLKNSRVSSKDIQKEMARRKLEQIKERIRSLKMTAGIDPAGTARQIAVLSRELAAAVKSYSAAAGPGAALVSDAGAKTDAAPSGEPLAVQSTAAQQLGPASEARNGPEAEEGTNLVVARAIELYQQAQTGPETQARERDQRATQAGDTESGVAKFTAAESADFIKTARDLAKALKDILQKIAQAAKAKGEQGTKDVEDAEASLGQLAQEIGFAVSALRPGLSETPV